MQLFEKWILAQAERCEIISFDVYDTLVHRQFLSPDMVFIYLENRLKDMGYDEPDFYRKRLEAERLARLNAVREEVTLDEIYHFYAADVDKEILKKAEIEAEIRCVYPDKVMKKIFDKLIGMDKKVIIISDMYLSAEMIERVLGKADYFGYEKIYVSSDIGLTKKTGHLFSYVMKESKDKSIIHIGDRYGTDFCNAREKGLKSIWYAYSPIHGVIYKYLRKHDDGQQR